MAHRPAVAAKDLRIEPPQWVAPPRCCRRATAVTMLIVPTPRRRHERARSRRRARPRRGGHAVQLCFARAAGVADRGRDGAARLLPCGRPGADPVAIFWVKRWNAGGAAHRALGSLLAASSSPWCPATGRSCSPPGLALLAVDVLSSRGSCGIVGTLYGGLDRRVSPVVTPCSRCSCSRWWRQVLIGATRAVDQRSAPMGRRFGGAGGGRRPARRLPCLRRRRGVGVRTPDRGSYVTIR